jgi:hypothetical protein
MKSGVRPSIPPFRIGPALHHLAPAAEVIMRSRLDVRVADALAAPAQREGEPLPEIRLMLERVQSGDRRGGAAQAGVRRHVLHSLALEPDLAPVAQRLEKSRSRAKSHGRILRQRRHHPQALRRGPDAVPAGPRRPRAHRRPAASPKPAFLLIGPYPWSAPYEELRLRK